MMSAKAYILMTLIKSTYSTACKSNHLKYQ